MGWVVLRVPLKEILLEYTSLSGDPQQFGVFLLLGARILAAKSWIQQPGKV